MELELKGKRAFVSGSSSGIGKGIAMTLAGEGCDVVVHGRNKARTEQTAHEIEKLGVKAFVTLGELTNDEDAAKVAKMAHGAAGRIDILINNCGDVLRKDDPDWRTLPVKEWELSFQTNFFSALRLSQHFAEEMKERRWGRIINISSMSGVMALGRLVDYATPKAAVNIFTTNISKDLGPFNVTVNTVIPGTIKTPAIDEYIAHMTKEHNWGNDPAEQVRRYTELWPQSVPRLGQPEDIGATVAFLVSPLAGYINGACLRVDGGMAVFM